MRMTTNKLALGLVLANVGIWGTLPAQAHADPGHVDSEIAALTDRAIAKMVPTLPDHCVGDTAVTWFAQGTHDGYAHGWTWNGYEHVWDYAKCGADARSLRSGMHRSRTCLVFLHERLHGVMGPEHVGPLHPDNDYMLADACQATEPIAAHDAMEQARACREWDKCWTWSTMGNRKRSVYLKGRGKRVNVGPCAFKRAAAKRRINWTRTTKLRGDSTARTYGCDR